MDYDNLIGLPLSEVKNILDIAKIKYKIVDNSSIQKVHDTIIVIKITKLEDESIELITDKFLLNI